MISLYNDIYMQLHNFIHNFLALYEIDAWSYAILYIAFPFPCYKEGTLSHEVVMTIPPSELPV